MLDNQHTFAFDYRKINWSDAKGYEALGWDDQNVYAFGYQYMQDNWALRAGYNHADTPMDGLPGATSPAAAAINFFDLLGLPANAEDHYTLGGSYIFSDMFSVDLAYVYSPKTTDTFDISALGMFPTISTSHKEDSVSFQLVYKF